MDLQRTQRVAGQLQLLCETGQALAQAARPEAALEAALAAVSRHTALEHAVLLVPRDGALMVVAARGEFAPRGTRLSAPGAYAAVLKAPARPLFRESLRTPLYLRDTLQSEWSLPLCALGTVRGVLVLGSAQRVATPSADDLGVLEAWGALVTPLLHGAPERRAPRKSAVPGLDQLTPRERQVLALLPRGMTNAALGEALGIAPGTVKIHVERILHKLGLRDRTQAAVLAVEAGVRA